MGKRSRSRRQWPKRHDAPARHTLRQWICAGCKARGCTLIACADGRQRCPRCKAALEAAPLSAAHPGLSEILAAGGSGA